VELKLKKLSPGKWEALEGSGEDKVLSPSISLHLPPSPTISLEGSGEDKGHAIHAVTRTPSAYP